MQEKHHTLPDLAHPSEFNAIYQMEMGGGVKELKENRAGVREEEGGQWRYRRGDECSPCSFPLSQTRPG